MSFDTVAFWLFFPFAWAAWRLTPYRWAKGLLLGFSLFFYAWWNPLYVLLLIVPTALDYYAGNRIYRTDDGRTKRRWLTLCVVSNIGLLAVFKYGHFALDNFVGLAGLVHWHVVPPKLQWVIPVGISFYTFQVLSYSFDIYRGVLKPAASFINFLQFVCFFPHLVAGPIVRAHELLPQFDRRRRLTPAAVQAGIYSICWGLFMKVVIADNIAQLVDYVMTPEHLAQRDYVGVWITVILFATQIFADFAGYSSIAIGLALLMGIRFPRNFNYPYISASLSEFWTRWHITLSRWLRDYLYIPLGGNRGGEMRTYANLMITMVLGGLWHGASWTFVTWGALHGGALAIERKLAGRRRMRPHDCTADGRIRIGAALLRLPIMLFVFVFILVTWVFFRAPTFSFALAVLHKMFVAPFQDRFAWPSDLNVYLWLLAPVALLHVGQLLREWFGLRPNAYVRSVAAALMLFAVITVERAGEHVFIYFQF